MKFWSLVTVVSAVLGLRKECPGEGRYCPDSATCCQLADKTYGCCPLENAVCCDDNIHCCPANTKCSVDLCIQNSQGNTSAVAYPVKSQKACPGGKSVCSEDSTCCESVIPGLYACCPLDSAVCCKDKIHCCPQNTLCDLKAGKCIGKGIVHAMYDSRKTLSSKQKFVRMAPLTESNISKVVWCPDGVQCPNANTCCKMPTGEWGCCPYPNAFCCSDQLHCCPQNMKCDLTSQSCIQGAKNISAVLKIAAEKRVLDKIICPDQTQCSDNMTCCKTGKEYGCCLYPNAVCCSDSSHCCPQNHTCDLIMKMCVPNTN